MRHGTHPTATHSARIVRIARMAALLGVMGSIVAAASGCATSGESDRGPLFYPSPPQRPRVQYLTSFANADDLEGRPSVLMRFLVGDTTSRRKLRKPTCRTCPRPA